MVPPPPPPSQLSNIVRGREIFLHRRIVLSAKSLYSEMLLPRKVSCYRMIFFQVNKKKKDNGEGI